MKRVYNRPKKYVKEDSSSRHYVDLDLSLLQATGIVSYVTSDSTTALDDYTRNRWGHDYQKILLRSRTTESIVIESNHIEIKRGIVFINNSRFSLYDDNKDIYRELKNKISPQTAKKIFAWLIENRA